LVLALGSALRRTRFLAASFLLKALADAFGFLEVLLRRLLSISEKLRGLRADMSLKDLELVEHALMGDHLGGHKVLVELRSAVLLRIIASAFQGLFRNLMVQLEQLRARLIADHRLGDSHALAFPQFATLAGGRSGFVGPWFGGGITSRLSRAFA